MSQFSEKLRKSVEDSGITIYQLAKKSELDRTTIQRSLSGERLPGVAFVEKLCDYLRVSPVERDTLMELYSICRIGEEVYAGRKYIEGMIEQIAGLHIYHNRDFSSTKVIVSDYKMNESGKAFVGQYGVNKLVRNILEYEVYNNTNPRISLSVPFAFVTLFDCLKQLYWESDGKVSIQHIVAFSKNPHAGQNPNINLEVLSDALPFAFCMGNGYQPHYYYTAHNDTENFMHIMPFYFFTDKWLVTLSADYKSAILYSDSEILRIYQQHFQDRFMQSIPLVQQLSSPLEMMVFGFGKIMDKVQITHVIEPQPCFAKYYTHEMVEKYVRQGIPAREEIKALACKLYDRYQAFEDPMESFFSMDGLQAMAKDGIIADLPPAFVKPITLEDRIYLLKALKVDIQADVYFARLIDTSKLQVSDVATIQIYKNQSLFFMAITDRGIVSCMINEQSICDAFYDFFQSVQESKLLYSKEDTVNVLNELIAQLEYTAEQETL